MRHYYGICDRCGAKFTGEDIKRDNPRVYTAEGVSPDLCQVCFDSLQAWIDGPLSWKP